ncbi:3D domain-containing protein [Longimicrobium sp.]|uniref:3D domain-containing protein n=1 Tax=Longimicrobium sp. TaxID=2029185 RepID=UPI003B3B283D
MTRRIMPDRGKYRWAAPLWALLLPLLLAALAPADAEAQRRPRLLGTPTTPPADTLRIADVPPAPDGTGASENAEPAATSSTVASRGVFPVQRVLQMRSTAYCLRGNMRTGVRVRDGMAAGDPSVLPLGSVVRVSHPDGRLIGIFVIMDTGGAVRGNKIDLWFDSCREASDWGTRSVVAEVLDIGRA